MIKLTDEEKDTLSYDDVAYLILKEINKKIKIIDLFKKVLAAMDEPESNFEDEIGDFFESLVTDKRFIMLDNGYCDLKVNHSTKVIIDEDDEDLDISLEEDNLDDVNNGLDGDNYDEEANPDDDTDDDLQDLVIIDDSEELDSDMN
jgi:DNA-directed RNA polymerase delta subunit